jgi:Tol biopolymer transport system component
MMNTDGARPRRLAVLADSSSGSPRQLRWSPNGRQIAFSRCCARSGSHLDVGLIRSDGSGLRWITDASDPTWAPDGERLALRTDFGPGWREGAQTIAVENPDGSGRRVVVRADDVNAYHLSAPAWSPRGSAVALAIYRRVGGGFPLLVVDVDDPAAVREVAPLGYNPAWSPDGGRLAFTGQRGIWVAGNDGSRARLVVSSKRVGGGARNPVWSPEGKRIAFVAGGNTGNRPGNLFVVTVSRGRPRILARRIAPEKPIWSPNGRKLYYVASH